MTKDQLNPNHYLKAIFAAVVAALAVLEVAIEPVTVGGVVVEAAGAVTAAEWMKVLVVATLAAGAVWGVPNSPQSEKSKVVTSRPVVYPEDGNIPSSSPRHQTDTWGGEVTQKKFE